MFFPNQKNPMASFASEVSRAHLPNYPGLWEPSRIVPVELHP
jgi:hypothetical protein